MVKLSLAALGEGDVLDIALSAAALATFGLARVATGALQVSGQAVQGLARLNAGKIAAQSPAVRAAAGLPSHANSARVIDELMGAANLQKGAARGLVRDFDAHGQIFSRAGAQEAWHALRRVPGQSLDDIRNIRHFDARHPVTQFRTAEGAGSGMSFLGERQAGAQLQTLGRLDPRVLESAGMSTVQSATFLHTGAVQSLWAVGAGLQGVDAVRMLNPDPSASQTLHLRGDAPVPVGPPEAGR